jgi:hypothetical protein
MPVEEENFLYELDGEEKLGFDSLLESTSGGA